MSAFFYDSPHQFTPLIPGQIPFEPLLAKASAVQARALAVKAQASPLTLTRLRELVRAMNSYYSNTIEGQGTHPLHIEEALHHDFSGEPDIARRQRLAIAHIQAEIDYEHWLSSNPSHPTLSSESALKAHTLLLSRLTEADRLSSDGGVIVPGQLRKKNVVVGRHRPPEFNAIPKFLNAFDQEFARPSTADAYTLVRAACAHQRLAWIHPFLDGNGRAIRLQTHGALLGMTQGLWSVNRGFARNRDDYYHYLDAADGARRGDLDGRGNLTEKGLVQWVDYFLDVCLDQADFMGTLLDLKSIRKNIDLWIASEGQENPHIRREASLPLQHLFMVGEMPRKDFFQMTSLGERNARYLVSALLKKGLLSSQTTLGPLRFEFPLSAIRLLFPGLYPEASAPMPKEAWQIRHRPKA